jgi:hypothetical protein
LNKWCSRNNQKETRRSGAVRRAIQQQCVAAIDPDLSALKAYIAVVSPNPRAMNHSFNTEVVVQRRDTQRPIAFCCARKWEVGTERLDCSDTMEAIGMGAVYG